MSLEWNDGKFSLFMEATSLADGPQRERRLVECFSQLTSLEELSVCNVGWLTNPMIKALEKLPRLRRLSINSCKSLDMTCKNNTSCLASEKGPKD